MAAKSVDDVDWSDAGCGGGKAASGASKAVAERLIETSPLLARRAFGCEDARRVVARA